MMMKDRLVEKMKSRNEFRELALAVALLAMLLVSVI
jgi:hypothetical protein